MKSRPVFGALKAATCLFTYSLMGTMWARPPEVMLTEIETCLQRKVTPSLLKIAPDFSFKSVSPRHLRLYYFRFASNCFFTSLSRTCSNIGKINGAEKTHFLSGVRKSPTYIITNRQKAIQYLIAICLSLYAALYHYVFYFLMLTHSKQPIWFQLWCMSV